MTFLHYGDRRAAGRDDDAELAQSWASHAFVVAALVSLALVAGYLRAVAGWNFARVAALAQFAYLVLFSHSFFFSGLTGLTITIGAIVTLARLMALTAKVNWAAKFAAAPGRELRTPPPVPAPQPAS